MASGKGHSKGFNHYMCKKFFHPGNPQNLETVFVARQNHERAKQEEAEKLSEYEREQEAYKAKEIMSLVKGKSQLSRDRLALSFMYEPPVGVRGAGVQDPGSSTSGVLKLKKKEGEKEGDEEGGDPDAFCYTCKQQGHPSNRCPREGEPLFEWQRKAPREAHIAKGDPNVIDKPFGIKVEYTRCQRCNVMGHTHTEKYCPLYGKARDNIPVPESEEPTVALDEKKLIAKMKEEEGLVFNSFGLWDNGKNAKGKLVRKHYDLVFSSEDESKLHNDLLVELVTKLKTKKKRKKSARKSSKKDKDKIIVKKEKRIKNLEKDIKNLKKEIKIEQEDVKTEVIDIDVDIKKEPLSSDSDEESDPSPQKRRKKGKKSKKSKLRKLRIKEEVESEEEDEAPEYTAETMSKIDDILFADIGNLKNKKQKKSYLSEVDKILSIGEGVDGSSDKDDESEDRLTEESDETEDDLEEASDELTEAEMRLLNLISVNKIDVKLNFPKDYPDTACHFCREPEDSRHLASCPVYDTIMRGTEFEDIRSSNPALVRRGLANIRAALLQRCQALSFTSVGDVSRRNMLLLTPSERIKSREEQGELLQSRLMELEVEEILQAS